jgi:hypothetical protein
VGSLATGSLVGLPAEEIDLKLPRTSKNGEFGGSFRICLLVIDLV